MAANVDTLYDSASDTLDHLQRSATPAIQRSKRQAAAVVGRTGEMIDSLKSQAYDAAGDVGNKLVAYANKNPLTALLIAAGAGALLVTAARSVKSRH